jgi:hypothetical protein
MRVRVLLDVSLPSGRNAARGEECEMPGALADLFLGMVPPRVCALSAPPQAPPAVADQPPATPPRPKRRKRTKR